MSSPPDSILDELDDTQKQLELLYNIRLQGILVRSKAQWMECGEKCTFFFKLVHRNYTRKNIQKLKISDETFT